jgi:hypothetical protein
VAANRTNTLIELNDGRMLGLGGYGGSGGTPTLHFHVHPGSRATVRTAVISTTLLRAWTPASSQLIAQDMSTSWTLPRRSCRRRMPSVRCVVSLARPGVLFRARDWHMGGSLWPGRRCSLVKYASIAVGCSCCVDRRRLLGMRFVGG